MATRDIFVRTRQLIINAVNPALYPESVITRVYQTPNGDNFIVYDAIQSKKTSIKGYSQLYTDYSKSIETLVETTMQIDVYSKDYDISVANDTASSIYQYLTEEANYYLKTAYTDNDIYITEVDDIINNSDLLDRSAYTSRYTINFTLTNHILTVRNNRPAYYPVTIKNRIVQ